MQIWYFLSRFKTSPRSKSFKLPHWPSRHLLNIMNCQVLQAKASNGVPVTSFFSSGPWWAYLDLDLITAPSWRLGNFNIPEHFQWTSKLISYVLGTRDA